MLTVVRSGILVSLLLIGAPAAYTQTAQQDGEHREHHPESAAKPVPAPAVPQPAMRGATQGNGMPNGSAAGMGMMGGDMPMTSMMVPHQHVEGRLAFLRTELGITPTQESAWLAFASAVRAHTNDMGHTMGMMGANTGTGWIARLERHEKMAARHLEGVRALKSPATALYNALSAEQKKVANTIMVGPMGPMGPM